MVDIAGKIALSRFLAWANVEIGSGWLTSSFYIELYFLAS